MMWVRLYLTTATLGALFGVDKATVGRNGRGILAVLRRVSEGEIGWPDQRGTWGGPPLDDGESHTDRP